MGFLDYVVIIGIILMAVVVGYLSSLKAKSTDEFIMAGRSLNKMQVAFSMAATNFGASGLVLTVGLCYMTGMGGVWWNLSSFPAFLFVGLFLIQKLYKLTDNTVPGYLGRRYSPACATVSSATHFISTVLVLSTQFTIATTTFSTLTGLDPTLVQILFVSLVFLLTVGGGLRSVINTDAIMFVFIMLSMLITFGIVTTRAGGLGNVLATVPSEKLNLFSTGFAEPISLIVMVTFSYGTDQSYVQRMLSCKDEQTAKFALFFTSGFILVCSLILGVIGLSIGIVMPGITDVNGVYSELLVTFPQGILGLAVAGLFTATVTTASSLLHSATTLFVSDLYTVVKKSKEPVKVWQLRLTTTVIATISLLISIYWKDVRGIIYTATLFYSTAVFFPLFLGLNSKKPTAKGALYSILGSIAFGIFWEFTVYTKLAFWGSIPSNVISAFVGLAILVVVSKLDRKIRI